MRVYNGLISIGKQKNFQLFGKRIESIKNFFLFPEKRFDKNEAVFKTLSPFLVRSLQNGDYYLYPKNANLQTNDKTKYPTHLKYWEEAIKTNFEAALKKSVKSLLSVEEDIDIVDMKIVIVPILHGSGNVNHEYLTTFPGIKGILKIQGHPEVLKLIYDIGIGARRSEGFGMLEVVE